MLDPNIGGLTTAMVDFTISRDIKFSFHSNDAGTKHGYSVTAETWATRYIRTKWFDSAAKAKAATVEFRKNFNAAATAIEQRGYRDPIMKPMVDAAIFRTEKKIRSEFQVERF